MEKMIRLKVSKKDALDAVADSMIKGVFKEFVEDKKSEAMKKKMIVRVSKRNNRKKT